MPDMTKNISETEIHDRVDRMLTHLDRLLDAVEMDHETYVDAVRFIALWEERAMAGNAE